MFLFIVFLMLSRLFIATLWSPAGKSSVISHGKCLCKSIKFKKKWTYVIGTFVFRSVGAQ